MIGEVIGLSRDILKRIFPDKTELAIAESKLEELRENGELTYLMAKNQIAVEEARSSDKWVARARPSFMYVFYAHISFLVIVAPILGIFFHDHMLTFYSNVKLGFEAIPREFWTTFTFGFMGYTGARTYEKVKKVIK